MTRIISGTVLFAFFAASVCVGEANAVTLRKCPDGTKVADSQPCSKKKAGTPKPNLPKASANKTGR